jgi:hypothetical protein
MPRVTVYPPDYSKVPGGQLMSGAVFRYIEHGVGPGDFLTGVICNDLKRAFAHADQANTDAMGDWVKFFYNEVQSEAWGSPEKMKDWLDAFDEDGHVKDE